MENLEKMNLLVNSIPGSAKTSLAQAPPLTLSQCGAPDDLPTAIKLKYIEDRYERNSRFQFLWNKLGSVLSDINQQCGREVVVAITPPREVATVAITPPSGPCLDKDDKKTLKIELPAINIQTKLPEMSMTRKVVEIEMLNSKNNAKQIPPDRPKNTENKDVQNQFVFVKEEKDDPEYGNRNGFNSMIVNKREQDEAELANEERLYPCDKCNKTYKQKGHLGAHIRVAHYGVRFPCPHCDYKSTTNGNLKKHIEAKHIEAFQDFTVTEDMIEMDNDINDSMYDPRIGYDRNSHQFNNGYNDPVNNYDIDNHVVDLNLKRNDASEPCDGVSEACDEVSEPSPKRQRLAEEDHEETVPEDPEDSQKASISDFLEVSLGDGVVDADIEEGDDVENNDVNDDFAPDNDVNDDFVGENENSLDNLMIKQEFAEDGSFVKHEQIELDESELSDLGRIYTCDQCDKTFKQKGHLGVHLKAVHQGIRFPCSICDYKATTKGNLKQHVGRRHKFVDNDMIDYDNIEGVVENESNGVLAIMDNDSFGFKEEQSEEFDMTPPARCYPCEMCDKTFKQKGHLGVHIKSFHQGMRFPCTVCNYKATTNGNLKRHIEQRHVPQTENMWAPQIEGPRDWELPSEESTNTQADTLDSLLSDGETGGWGICK